MLFLKTRTSINPILQLQITSDTSVSAEHLLSTGLVAAISLYMIWHDHERFPVKSPSHKQQDLRSFMEVKRVQGSSKTLRVGV